MWNIVSIVAAVVVVLLLFEVLDVAELLKKKLKGKKGHGSLETRLQALEERVAQLERRAP